MKALSSCCWPPERAAEALEALAAASGLGVARSVEHTQSSSVEPLESCLVNAGGALGVEVETVTARHFELPELVRGAAPAIFRVNREETSGFVLLVACRHRRATLLAPDLSRRNLPVETLRAALAEPLEAPLRERIEKLLDTASVPQRRRNRARHALLDQQLASAFASPCWILRPLPGSSFRRQLAHVGVHRQGCALMTTHLAQYLLFLASWWLIGRGVFRGTLDVAWLVGWALLLVSMVPLRMLGLWLQGKILVTAGGLLRRRLLAGVTKLDLESTTREGTGMLLGRVIEADTLERVAISGGAIGLLALIEVVVTLWVLAKGAGGLWHSGLFAAWVVLTALLVYRFYQRIVAWTEARLDLSHELTERMVGHRTRLAQQAPEHWHDGEDGLLFRHIAASEAMDRIGPWVGQSPFAWRIVGFLGLAAPFIGGSASISALAVGFGGVLLGSQALGRLATGFNSVAVAIIAWQRVARIFHAAERDAVASGHAVGDRHGEDDELVRARDMAFRYPDRERLALDHASLDIHVGDKLLLVGPSGGGKSTLVSLLAGLRRPNEGLLLCHGLDLATLGEDEWRRRISAAPQFHDNHVLAESFAFNLLMGRDWPPTLEQLDEAEALCRELGLGDLLDRMPSGMLQMVGDTGWQLSHGEQSRLFVARALLQDADLVILDESFGALDPENLRLAINCARRRAKTLMVVAHP